MKYNNCNNTDKIIYEPGDWIYRRTNSKHLKDCIVEFVFKIDKIDQDPIGRPAGIYCFDNFNCVRYDNKTARHKSGYFDIPDICEEFRPASQKEIDEATKIIEKAKKMPELEIAGHQVEFEINLDSIFESRITIGCKTLTYGRILTIRGTMVDYGITGLRVTGKGGNPFMITFAEVEDLISIIDRANPSLLPSISQLPQTEWKHAPACDVRIKRSV